MSDNIHIRPTNAPRSIREQFDPNVTFQRRLIVINISMEGNNVSCKDQTISDPTTCIDNLAVVGA